MFSRLSIAAVLLPLTFADCNQGRGPAESDSKLATAVATSSNLAGAAGHAGGEPSLRALDSAEVTPAITSIARHILHEHADEPLGYEVPFELEGKRYVARIEQHYHAPGSGREPVGEHVGVTVYVIE